MTSPSEHLKKLQDLLRQLFQFDCADLDFGIYRIMNFKRAVLEKFIEKDLIGTIATELDTGALAEQSEIAEQLVDVAKSARENLGDDAIDGDGNLAVKHADTKVGRKYLELQAKSGGAQARPALEAAVFNHLYSFFSRYYDAGDFMSKRRYSRKEKYAVPYNGEEVYLHWANKDQYYIKTGEYFTDYRFSAPNGIAVHFRIQAADVEKENIKGENRFFVPLAKKAAFDSKAKEIILPFEYRPLTKQEDVRYGQRNQQDAIIAEVLKVVPKLFSKDSTALAALIAERRKTSDGQTVSYFEHHLRQYTRRNTSDFFIHKDLNSFLTRELDFYLKNEVLGLDEMEAGGEGRTAGWFQLIHTIKSIGRKIIAFLAQIEDFQKKLFEKRKFIVETQYCITVGNIDESFYGDIAACNAQWAEWKELFHIDEEQSDLFSHGKTKKDKRISCLKAHPSLVLDTKHYSQAFTDRLLGSFEGLDSLFDGTLIHSENFQALVMLLDLFRGRVECIYIDPPYNTGDSEILYKNEYLRSSWLSLMHNRLSVAMRLLTDDPVVFIAIDDFEMVDLAELVDKHFPFLRREMIVVNHHPQGGKAKVLANTHEYMLACVRQDSDRTLSGRISKDGMELRPFKRSGTAESNFRYGRPNSFYAVLVDPNTKVVIGIEPPPDRNAHNYPTGKTKEGFLRIYPLSGQTNDSPDRTERVWRRSFESCQNLIDKKQLQCSDNMTIYQSIDAQDRTPALFSNWVDPRYNAGIFGANLLGDIIGEHNPFSYPKSVHTVEDAIFAAGVEDDAYCADFFGGSGTTGHAVINLNREDGGNRKFIMAEIGQYFDTVLLPRIKKVTFAPEWKKGKPLRQATAEEAKRSPRIVKYIRLEGYEDALNNIEFDEEAGQRALQFDDYLLNYMLDWETKGSETFLNVEKLANPFDYKLRIAQDGQTGEKVVDLPETFNYLLGLHIKTRKVYHDKDRRYLVYHGTVDSRQICVIWRITGGWSKEDFERDKRFVAEQKIVEGADEVFVNSDSVIPGARSLDPVFKARMFAPVAANGGY